MKNYLNAMRIKHYIKNILMFAPIFFSGKLFSMDKNLILYILLTFISFSLMSSTVYFINDIQDINKDKLHPKKKNRPIASGKISVASACLFSAIIFILSVLIAVWISVKLSNFLILFVVVLYFGVNLCYSIFHLKDIALLDISIIAIGFFLRLYIGSIVSGVTNSSWIYLVVITGSFYLGFGKRKSEMIKVGVESRNSLKKYNINFLNMSMYTCMTLAIAFFALWSKEKQEVNGNIFYVLLVPMIMLICFKYNLDAENEMYDGDPVNTILADKVLGMMIAIIIVIFYCALYLR